jgi:outer membrane immunogenic protein
MRRATLLFAASAAFGLALSQTALAADLPIRAPVYKAPPPMVVYNWSGCYLGGQLGYAWQRDRLNETLTATGATTDTLTASPNGFKGGGYLGCNWQWSGPFVVGLEADAEYADLTGSANYTASADYFDSRTHFQGSVRGRIGYAFDRALFYATGGWAVARVEHKYVTPGISESFTNTLNGWTVGGGVDYAFAGNWIGRIEYRYADFGNVTNVPVVAWTGFTEKHAITEHAVRIGLAYKF